MFIYQPDDASDRVVWRGGESTQLHYEEHVLCVPSGNTKWIELSTRTFCDGVPTGVNELQQELVDFYNYCN